MADKQSTGSKPLNKDLASDFIAANLEDILCRWEDAVREKVPAAKRQQRLLLRDHLVPYVEAIIRLLRTVSVETARSNISSAKDFDPDANVTHGRLRATLPGYTVAELIEEYVALRQIITDRVDQEGLLDAQVQEVISAVNEQAIILAASEFTSSLHVLRQKAISMLMHDIRNPLNTASITAEFVKRQSPEHTRAMDAILSNTRRIDGMVSELLDAVKLEAGEGLELQFSEGNLCKAVATAIEGARLAYPDRVEATIPDEAMETRFDPAGIARAVENLVGNALKYGDREKAVCIELSSDAEHYRIAVHNWGKPISAEEQASIFVAFARSQDADKNQAMTGWGLGLTYVKAVAEGHGGHVQLESNEEKGTTFTIVLPRG